MYISISNPSLRCSWVTLSHVWLGVVTQHWCQTNQCSLFFLWLYSFFEKNVCRLLKTQFFNYVVWRFWDKAIQNFIIQSFQINLSIKHSKKYVCEYYGARKLTINDIWSPYCIITLTCFWKVRSALCGEIRSSALSLNILFSISFLLAFSQGKTIYGLLPFNPIQISFNFTSTYNDLDFVFCRKKCVFLPVISMKMIFQCTLRLRGKQKLLKQSFCY